MPDPLSPETIARMKREHVRGVGSACPQDPDEYCVTCCDSDDYSVSWPCDAAQLLAELERREQVDREREAEYLAHSTPGVPWHEYLGVEYHVHSMPIPPLCARHDVAGVSYGLCGPATAEEVEG